MEAIRQELICEVDPREHVYSLLCPFVSLDLSLNTQRAERTRKGDAERNESRLNVIKACLADAIALFRAQERNAGSKASSLMLLHFIRDYLHTRMEDAHVCRREFEFIYESFYNKAAFVRLMRK